MVFRWYILPIGGLYITYHLLREPGNSIEKNLFTSFTGSAFQRWLAVDWARSLGCGCTALCFTACRRPGWVGWMMMIRNLHHPKKTHSTPEMVWLQKFVGMLDIWYFLLDFEFVFFLLAKSVEMLRMHRFFPKKGFALATHSPCQVLFNHTSAIPTERRRRLELQGSRNWPVFSGVYSQDRDAPPGNSGLHTYTFRIRDPYWASLVSVTRGRLARKLNG